MVSLTICVLEVRACSTSRTSSWAVGGGANDGSRRGREERGEGSLTGRQHVEHQQQVLEHVGLGDVRHTLLVAGHTGDDLEDDKVGGVSTTATQG